KMLREATKDKWPQTVAMTVLGGFLAAGVGLLGNWHSHRLQARRKKQEDNEFVVNILRAIRRELETLAAIYEGGMGKELAESEPTKPLRARFAFSQSYFTVFEANAVHLGKIDGPTSSRIIKVYAMLKSMVENFRINNSYLDTLASLVAEN